MMENLYNLFNGISYISKKHFLLMVHCLDHYIQNQYQYVDETKVE